jgi:hypothetical protein
VPSSNTVAAANPASGRTVPAGFCDTGGDAAARAASMVGGVLSSGFDEQPATSTTKIIRPKKRR